MDSPNGRDQLYQARNTHIAARLGKAGRGAAGARQGLFSAGCIYWVQLDANSIRVYLHGIKT
jgi:hypothetical protein